MRTHRWILAAWAGAAWLLSFAAADAPSPTPRPSPRKVFSDEDLKKYQSPSPSPAPSPAGGRTGTAARPASPGTGGTTGTTGSGTGARPYRRKPQVNVDPGARRKNEGETEQDRETERRQESEETRTTRPSRADDDEPGEAPDPRAQQEAAWRARADQARNDLNRARGAVTSAEDEVSSIAQRLLMSTDSNEILRLRSAQQEAEAKLAQARLALTGAELAVTNLEEDARRNNVPPGWIRER